MNFGKIFRGFALLLSVLLAIPFWVLAQDLGGDKPFTPEQLDQMVAPIALYPDALLAQVLMASTYPLEVVQADRWVKRNSTLEGDSLNAALDQMDWDMSIKALVAFPQVLSMMSEQLDWTQKLGDAFLAQQADVMDSVQRLRAKAHDQGNLASTKQQKVVVEEKAVVIEPLDPQVIYVPVYDPVVVYGPWPYPAYPPYVYCPAGAVVAAGVIGFAAGVAVGAAWCSGWGHWNWGGGTLNVNVNRNININNLKNTNIQTHNWNHDPAHRKGVAYRDEGSRQRYSQQSPGSADARRDYRGHSPNPGQSGTGSMGRGESRPSAFEGMEHGSEARWQSDRGQMSRESAMRSGGMGGGEFHGGGGMHGGFGGRR